MMTHGHLFDLCLLYPHSHLPTFQTTSFLARALFCLPAGPLLRAAHHPLAGAILSKCHGDHSTSCLKPSVSVLTAFRVKYTKRFQAFQALDHSVPASPSRLTPYLSAVNALCSGHSGFFLILSCLCIGSHPSLSCPTTSTPLLKV